jgi:hypothetical protein
MLRSLLEGHRSSRCPIVASPVGRGRCGTSLPAGHGKPPARGLAGGAPVSDASDARLRKACERGGDRRWRRCWVMPAARWSAAQVRRAAEVCSTGVAAFRLLRHPVTAAPQRRMAKTANPVTCTARAHTEDRQGVVCRPLDGDAQLDPRPAPVVRSGPMGAGGHDSSEPRQEDRDADEHHAGAYMRAADAVAEAPQPRRNREHVARGQSANQRPRAAGGQARDRRRHRAVVASAAEHRRRRPHGCSARPRRLRRLRAARGEVGLELGVLVPAVDRDE